MNQQLLDSQGRRKYFTPDERRMFMAASINAPREVRSLCAVLHDTGCRISEALALTVKDIDLAERRIVIKCLKKKNGAIVFRKVPVPPELLDMLDMVHGLRQLRQKRKFNEHLWTWSRMHAWRRGGTRVPNRLQALIIHSLLGERAAARLPDPQR
jgi:integrase/recombinase XerD